MMIQAILCFTAILAFVVYLGFFRSMLGDRVLAVCLLALSLGAILFPDATHVVARMVGVGRGADLILYLFVACSVVLFILLYGKIGSAEIKITELARAMAIANAERPDEGREEKRALANE
jgi:small membrane protein